MPKSLADLRAAPPQTRPERSVTLCLAPALIGEVQSLSEELSRLQRTPDEDGGPPRRAAEPESGRSSEIRVRLADLVDEMAEHEGEMRLRANKTDGEWRNWVNAHPARDEGQPGYDRDMRVARGICNADDLIDDLAAYTHAWNGELLAPGDFTAIFEPTVATADKQMMAEAVVAMYESRLDFSRLRTSLSADLQRLSGLSSPATSDSPTSGSTDGNPPPFSEATTGTATA